MRTAPWMCSLVLLACAARTGPVAPEALAPAAPSATPAASPAPVPSAMPAASLAPATSATPATSAPAGTYEPLSISASKAHADGQNWAVDVRAPGRVAVGGAAEIEVVLVAKNGYKINDKYPFQLKTSADPPDVVAFDKAELARSDATFTKTQARFAAKLSGKKKGVVKAGGTLSLSVCRAKECITDQVALDVPITIR